MRNYPTLILLILAICLPIGSVVVADTIIPGGTLVGNYVWTLANSPYVIQGSVSIPHHEDWTEWNGDDQWTPFLQEPFIHDWDGDNVWDSLMCEDSVNGYGHGKRAAIERM